jgi:hypothetical protein
MEKTFFMPAYSGEIFEVSTEERFRTAFTELARISDPENRPRFLQMLCFLPDDRGEFCIPEKLMRFIGLRDEHEALNDPARKACMSELHAAWGMDRLADQSIVAHPLPWKTIDIGPRISGKYLSIYWSPDVTLITQEHLPTFLEYTDNDPLGAHWNRSYRTAIASAVFPDADSEHARLKRHAGIHRAKSEIRWLWEQMIQGCDEGILLNLSELEQPTSLE